MNDILKITSQYDDKIYVEVSATNACNQKCYYCCFKQQNDIKFINLKDLSAFILNLYYTFNKDIIIELIGGEPTLLDESELIQFSDCISTVYPHVKIMLFSNFSASVDLYNHMLKNSWTLFLAWHSLVTDRYNQEFIDKCNNLTESCYIYVMFENRYVDQSLKAYDELRKSKHYVSLCELIYDKNTTKITDLNECYSDEQIKLFHDIKRNEQNTICSIKTNQVVMKKQNDIIRTCLADDITNRNFRHYKCSAGKTYMFINQDGNIYPCRNYLQNAIGNIRQQINNIKFKDTLCSFDSCPTIVKTTKEKIFR